MARLGDVCDILNGFAFKSEQYVDRGIRIIRIANVQKGFIEDSTPVFYPFDSKDAKKYSLEEGDMLMSLTGNVGRVAKISKEFLPAALNQRVACLRIKDGVALDKAFLFNLLNSDYFEQQCIAASKGVAQKNMSTEWLKEYEIPMFPIEQQKAIASLLDKVSELIALRKEQLAKLDQLVKSRFIELFGDPVTNEKNWVRLTLGDICEIGSSKRVFEKNYVPSGIPFFRTKEIVELSKGTPISTELFITEEHFAELKKSYGAPKKDDLLISAVGTIGTIWIVSGEYEFYFKDGNLIQIKASSNFNSIFMKYLLDELIANYKKELSTGTAYSALTIAGLKKMLVYDVPLTLQEQFAAFVKQTDKSKLAIQQSLDKLELLKKCLIQQYFGSNDDEK